MTNCFNDLLDLGKKIDEGIEHLENKLANPYSLGVVTQKSAALCETTIESLENEMKDLLESIQLHTKEEREDLEEIQSDIDVVNECLRGLMNDINLVESSLSTNPDYLPFSKPLQDNVSPGNSVIDVGLVNKSILKDLTNCENLIGNESPNFLSPNCNSTPEPDSSSRDTERKALSHKRIVGTPFNRFEQKHNDISRLSENTFRSIDTPSNLSKYSNRSYLRNHSELPRIPALLSELNMKKVIESPKEPECSFQLFNRPQRNFKRRNQL